MTHEHPGMPSLDWNEIEPRIRPHVRFLRDAGFQTISSCGHQMYVMLDCAPADLPALEAALLSGDYRDFEIKYEVQHGFSKWTHTTVTFGGDLAGDEKPFDYVLLKVEPDAHPLYFVIQARTWHDVKIDPSGDEYFYGVHTCPTNWMGNIAAVISKGNDDPHGFATFVARRGSEADPEDTGWTTLFPEIQEGE